MELVAINSSYPNILVHSYSSLWQLFFINPCVCYHVWPGIGMFVCVILAICYQRKEEGGGELEN